MPLIVALAALVTSALAVAQPADLLVRNANIYTMESRTPRAKEIAVRGDRIAAVGDNLASHSGPNTRVIDAPGATLVPGFIDSHGHMRGLGESLEILDLRHSNTVSDVVSQVKQAAASRKSGEWITGRAWDQTRWPGAQFPTADDLTAVSQNHPVYLTRVDGHAAWVNRKALELADVNAATSDPPGGKIHHDRAGRPTGILIDRAMGLVGRKIPPSTPEQIRNRIARAAEECARLGLTSVHDAGTSAEDLSTYRALIQGSKLPVRVYAMIRGEGPLWDQYCRSGPEVGSLLTVRSVKLVADGALGSRGAALKQPYSDDPRNSGLQILPKSTIERVAHAAYKAGLQVNTHAIGDLANRTVLDAYAAVLPPGNDRRFRVEHAQVVSLEDFALFARFRILPSVQAVHATSDMRWAQQRVGPDRVKGAYAWQRFLALGLPIANGSDFPVENANPLWGFYASITRQDHAGAPPGGWQPDQCMTREQALRSFTLDAAFAAFEEREKGSLAPGKLADFVLLSRDIMTIPPAEILETRVTHTVLGGRIVYQEKH